MIKDVIKKLTEFRAAEEDIDWRIGSKTKKPNVATALAFVDPRLYSKKLNEIAPEAWSATYEVIDVERNIVKCSLTIYDLTRESFGEKSAFQEGISLVSAESQAFKRACSYFGLFAYLYDFPVVYAEIDGNYISKKPAVPPQFLPPRLLTFAQLKDVKTRAFQAGVDNKDAMNDLLQSIGRGPDEWENFTNHEANKLLDIIGV